MSDAESFVATSPSTQQAPVLINEDLSTIHRDGYILIRGGVPRELVQAALYTINAGIGEYGIKSDTLPSLNDDSFVPQVRQDETVLGLLYGSGLFQTANELLGQGKVETVRSAQIALRFPGEVEPVVPHVDGLLAAPFKSSPARAPLSARIQSDLDEQTAPSKLHSFSALVGVFLSDVARDDAGNLTVWPTSQDVIARFYWERGPNGLFEGMPPLEPIEPIQLHAEAGDAVICNYSLAHGIGPNRSPNIRYAVYFRLFKHGHRDLSWECMKDPWLEWEGVPHGSCQ